MRFTALSATRRLVLWQRHLRDMILRVYEGNAAGKSVQSSDKSLSKLRGHTLQKLRLSPFTSALTPNAMLYSTEFY